MAVAISPPSDIKADILVGDRKASAWKKRPILFRKWDPRDLFYAFVVLSVHVLCLCAPFTTVTKGALWLAVIRYLTSGLFGIVMGYHRYITHKSFKLPKPLEYTMAYLGLLALQGDPIFWVSTHRNHHKFADTPRDPHSPTEGFGFAHVFWIFDKQYLHDKTGGYGNVQDLTQQWFYRFLESTMYAHILLLAVGLYVVGGFPYLVWGVGVATCWGYHSTFIVNSLGHLYGRQSWDSGDSSRNNWFLNIFTFGDGWHNNHHAFEWSARHGLEWWEFDPTWYMIKLMASLGIATNVKVPSDEQKKNMKLKSDNYGRATIREQS